MKMPLLIIAGLILGTGPAFADNFPLQDPTGCATGSAVANCRSLPPLNSGPGGSSLRDDNRHGSSSSQRRMKPTRPLPSELLIPPGSTGLDKGSTGIDKTPLKPKKSH